jgi:D-glycero-alpha-D-manno-heptose-7-phosphate kinase
MTKIFLDTASLKEIEEVNSWGIIDGVTTNQKLFLQEGGTDFKQRVIDICNIVDGPVSVETTTHGFDEMVEEAKEYASWNKNIVIKVAMSADGNGLKVVKRLTAEGIKTNMTVMMTFNQLLLATKAGATYVSLFYNRAKDAGEDPVKIIKDYVAFVKDNNVSAQLIVGSIRKPEDVSQAVAAGAHILTIPTKILVQMPYHPKTEDTIKEFDEAWQGFLQANPHAVSRTPFRIPLGGGGTDLPSYYKEHEGFFISGAINKYIYVTIHKRFLPGLKVSYSKTENVKNASELEHPIVREVLKYFGINDGLDIISLADMPAEVGLGSSGSFTVGLLKALYAYQNIQKSPAEIAEEACDIAMNRLHEPSGKQDEYAASFGGINSYRIDRSGKVSVEEMNLDASTVSELESNIMLFYTGVTRSSNTVLSKQQERISDPSTDTLEKMHAIKRIGLESKKALQSGNLRRFGELLHEHWLVKRGITDNMSSDDIDRWYSVARENGAIGGKIAGAGGGGFLMLYCEDDKQRLRSAMAKEGLKEFEFKFDFEGSRTVYNV